MSEFLGEFFSSKVRAAVLAFLLPRSHLGYSLTDLSRRLELPISSLQHECYKLARLEVLRDYRRGASRLYQPNESWPLLPALTALVGGALSSADVLVGATDNVTGVTFAELVLPRGDDSAIESYLILVGDLSIEQVDGVFARVQALMAAVVPPTQLELAFFRGEDWAARLAQPDDYWTRLVAEPTSNGSAPRH